MSSVPETCGALCDAGREALGEYQAFWEPAPVSQPDFLLLGFLKTRLQSLFTDDNFLADASILQSHFV